ncbi:DedA family protein [Streptomyces sp. TRM S81-3]|uniref:DedA family protein n=1 Tax=Streptomyces griseicoloratus TaxID=2752516 RepID=A0A926KXE5_9ACTN|nr:DedA family protein [Streptomyces griseicoloratus]MBD0417721.1 DedA family protein [Streptomyces griseicoloratus]
MTAIAAQTAADSGAAPQWINDLMDALGAPGAGLAIALENLFPPLPSEVILPLAGFAASSGRMDLLAALLWTTAGSVIGALALYGIGALLGRDRTVAIAGRLPLVKVADIEKTEAWFLRHGTKAVFFGRMIPIFRSLISVPAGVERMRLPVFLGLTTLGSAIWNTAFVLAGYALGDNWSEVTRIVSAYSKVVLVGAVLAVLVFIGMRLLRPGAGHRRRRRQGIQRSGPGDAPSGPAEVTGPGTPPAGIPAGSAPPPAPRARAGR